MTWRGSRIAVACLVVAACGFDGTPAGTADAPSIDAPQDAAAIDAVEGRVTAGLVGLWTFDESAGSTTAADSSGAGSPVAMRVVTGAGIAAPTFGGGTVSATSRSRMISMPERSRLAGDIVGAGSVTLEVWLRPAAATQGDAAAPRFVVGLAKSLSNRNVALLQRGDRWMAVARTDATTMTGTPELVSSSQVSTTDFTHVVIVADANGRQIYVDDRVELVDAVSGSLTWDTDALLLLFEEPTAGRHWIGSVSLVALYARALDNDEVHANFVQGPDAR